MIDRYTIDTERNAYFNGRDGVLYKNGERVAKIALKNDRPAIYVKAHSLGTEATRALRDDLGDERLEAIAESLRQDFWWHLAAEDISDYGYDEVFSSGRSGGWCIPHSARDSSWRWWENCAIDADFPEVESVDELSETDARRYWFFQAAEAITGEVEYLSTTGFDEEVRAAHDALEEARESVLVRGDN